MSIKMMNLVFERYTGSGNEMVLALAIADYANDEGKGIYPALSTLAHKSRQSESSARRQIKAMLEAGWLIRVNRGLGGRSVTNEYQINPEWIKGVNLTPFHVEQQTGSGAGSNSVGEGQSKASSSTENPSTAATGYRPENPSNLEPFGTDKPGQPDRVSGERVSNQARKGVTAMTPDPSEHKSSDARASARGRARATPEPDRNPDPARLRAWWRSAIHAEVVDVGAMQQPDSVALWPARSDLAQQRGTAAVSARELVDRLTEHFAGRELDGEQRSSLDTEMRRRLYAEMMALRQHRANAA